MADRSIRKIKRRGGGVAVAMRGLVLCARAACEDWGVEMEGGWDGVNEIKSRS